jgi:hypothetical protein
MYSGNEINLLINGTLFKDGQTPVVEKTEGDAVRFEGKGLEFI